VTAGALPAGLSLDPATGVIAGTPTVAGPYSVTIAATNAAGTATAVYVGSTGAPVTYAVAGAVWYDRNDDGLQDDGEDGVPGVRVALNDASGAPVATTVTNGGGLYDFDELPAGTYSEVFTAPAGYKFTTQTVGGDPTVDSNPGSAGVTAPFVLGPPGPGNDVTPSTLADRAHAPFIDRTIDAGLVAKGDDSTGSDSGSSDSGSGALPFTGGAVAIPVELGSVLALLGTAVLGLSYLAGRRRRAPARADGAHRRRRATLSRRST
jgi:hypothetical protein